MKKYIKSAHNISPKYVPSLINQLKQYLGISFYDREAISKASMGQWNFKISLSPYDTDPKRTVEKFKARLKSLGAKYITYRYGDIYFYLDTTKMEDELRQQQEASDAEYYAALDAFDVSKYVPTEAILKKLADYRARASKVNVKAIKSEDKLLTYYYGAMILGWKDLAYQIRDALGRDYEDEMNAIARQAKKQEEYADKRSPDDVALNIADSKGLFTFDKRRSNGKPDTWVPRKLLNYFIANNIPVHFTGRTPGYMYDRNGVQWSEVEHFTMFPDSTHPITYNLVVHTLESGGETTYTGDGTPERVSIQKVIEDIDRTVPHDDGVDSSVLVTM